MSRSEPRCAGRAGRAGSAGSVGSEGVQGVWEERKMRFCTPDSGRALLVVAAVALNRHDLGSPPVGFRAGSNESLKRIRTRRTEQQYAAAGDD